MTISSDLDFQSIGFTNFGKGCADFFNNCRFILKRIYVRLLTSCDARKSILTWHPTNLPSDSLKWILSHPMSYLSFTCLRKSYMSTGEISIWQANLNQKYVTTNLHHYRLYSYFRVSAFCRVPVRQSKSNPTTHNRSKWFLHNSFSHPLLLPSEIRLSCVRHYLQNLPAV